MAKYYYKKAKFKSKTLIRILSFGILICGLGILIYVLFPLISWQIYFAPVFATQNITSPIPKTTMVDTKTIRNLLSQASNIGVDYTNAQNWYPNLKYQGEKPKVESYILSIPALQIKQAVVSTADNNLAIHLVNYGGTSIPPQKGNAVIFGHSTLPQLFNPTDYKTIFANAYKLKTGDEIFVTIEGVTYAYRVESSVVVEPEDMSVFEQNYSDSYLTLVTCTPPGTIWKRLLIRAKLEAN